MRVGQLTFPSSDRRILRLGFLALNDAAPLAVAREKGLFARHGLRVDLRREVGWATLRDKISFGELDAAHTPAPMLWSTHLGLRCQPCPVLTSFVLSLNGNALTLSERLWQQGVRDAASFREEVWRRKKKMTFGVAFGFSSHHLLLRSWLHEAGVDPDTEIRIVIIPPDQMFRNLSSGAIEGYCAGEPWNSLAVREQIGWCPTWSVAQHPGHVEKVLMVTERFAEARAAEHSALIAALAESCAWCDEPSNREELADLLSHSAYINQTARIILPALSGHFDAGHGQIQNVPEFHVFHRHHANTPSFDRAFSLQSDLIRAGLLNANALAPELPRRLFREDLFRQALGIDSAAVLLSS